MRLTEISPFARGRRCAPPNARWTDAAYIALVLTYFVDISPEEWMVFVKSRDFAAEKQRRIDDEEGGTDESFGSKCKRLLPFGVLAWAIAAISLGIGSLEARLGFVAERRWGWSPEVTGLYLAAIFAAMVPITLGMAIAHRRWQFEDRVAVFCIFVSSMLSLLLIFGYNEPAVGISSKGPGNHKRNSKRPFVRMRPSLCLSRAPVTRARAWCSGRWQLSYSAAAKRSRTNTARTHPSLRSSPRVWRQTKSDVRWARCSEASPPSKTV